MRQVLTMPSRSRALVASVAALLCSGASAAPPGGVYAPIAEPEAVVASKAGFRPQAVSGRKGEALSLRLTTSDHEHCFAVDALRIEKRIVPGRATALEVTPDRAGTFEFHCCVHDSQAERGRLVVNE